MERWLDCLNCVLTVLATDDNHSAMNTPAIATPSTTYCQKQKRRQLAAANRNQMIPFETWTHQIATKYDMISDLTIIESHNG